MFHQDDETGDFSILYCSFFLCKETCVIMNYEFIYKKEKNENKG